YMTGNKRLFITWKPKDGGNVTFGDNTKGQIVGTGSIGNKDISISNVLHVKGLKHNLLSISQLCDKNCRVIFEDTSCRVVDNNNNATKFIGQREGNCNARDFVQCNISI
ncbi:hypothetical protein CFOL_v3_10955, partial [Cephalotus follicularis]